MMASNCKDFSGLINRCHYYSNKCLYKCCQQDSGNEDFFDPGNYLLVYPGEINEQNMDNCHHIVIKTNDYNGGQLGFCDENKINQSSCNMRDNYKTLDCRSYPFAPKFLKDFLVLVADTRCPIIQEEGLNKKYLDELYINTISAWKVAISENKKVEEWIKLLDLPTYKLYEYKK